MKKRARKGNVDKNRERKIAAAYFTISNLGCEPRELSVDEIYATYHSVKMDLAVEYCDDDEGVEAEYRDWYKKLGDPDSYASREWSKMRDEVKGL